LAERQLARERIFSFSTPTRERAEGHSFYGWMFNGERMYAALSQQFMLTNGPGEQGNRVHFETFPHAVTCALLGTNTALARLKRPQRSNLLRRHGVDTAILKSIDAIDAALCSLTAAYLLDGRVHWYGDQAGGYLLVPEPAGKHE
jgi:predicted RNase H-like nuclease